MEKKKISFISLLIILSTLITSIAVPVFAKTSDIKGHWAEKQIQEWLEKGFLKSYKDGTFKPDHPITRAEFFSITNKAFGFSEKTAIHFSDVPLDSWFAEDVAKALKAGYISGYEDETIRPNLPISRVEVAKILSTLLKLKACCSDKTEHTSHHHPFKDAANVPVWAEEYLNAVVEEKYFQGYADDTIQPLKSITRAEAVTVLYKAVRSKESVQQAVETSTNEQSIEGWLVDAHCAQAHVDKKNPSMTKKCLLCQNCEGSGYGIILKQQDGTYKFYKFDENGHKLAKENIISKTAKESDLTIAVKGILNGDIIKVSSISETNTPVNTEQEFAGVLIDQHCFSHINPPTKDTKVCLQMDECAASGYGVAIKQHDGSYKFYKFDENGQKLAKDILAKTKKDSNITLLVKGTLEGEKIKVSIIIEK